MPRPQSRLTRQSGLSRPLHVDVHRRWIVPEPEGCGSEGGGGAWLQHGPGCAGAGVARCDMELSSDSDGREVKQGGALL